MHFNVAMLLILYLELCGLCEVDPAADWWSLGAILFEILTGKVYIWLHCAHVWAGSCIHCTCMYIITHDVYIIIILLYTLYTCIYTYVYMHVICLMHTVKV